jgi:hypothetical protein
MALATVLSFGPESSIKPEKAKVSDAACGWAAAISAGLLVFTKTLGFVPFLSVADQTGAIMATGVSPSAALWPELFTPMAPPRSVTAPVT